MVDYATVSDSGFRTGMAAGNRFSAVENSLRAFIGLAMEKKKKENESAARREELAIRQQNDLARIREQLKADKELETWKQSYDKETIAWGRLSDIQNEMANTHNQLVDLEQRIESPDGTKSTMVMRAGKPVPPSPEMRRKLEGARGISPIKKAGAAAGRYLGDVLPEQFIMPGMTSFTALGTGLSKFAKRLGEKVVGAGKGTVQSDNLLTGKTMQLAREYLNKGIPSKVPEYIPTEAALSERAALESKLRELTEAGDLYASILAGGGGRSSGPQLSAEALNKKLIFWSNAQNGKVVSPSKLGSGYEIMDLETHPPLDSEGTPDDALRESFSGMGIGYDEFLEGMGGSVPMIDPRGERSSQWGILVERFLNRGWKIADEE